MNFRLSLLAAAFTLVLSACNMSVTSFPPSPTATDKAAEIPPTPFPDTPTPPAIDAPVVESPAFLEVHFVNELDAWGVSESWIVRTNDGGITWYDVTPSDVEEMGSAVETFILDRDHAWIQKPDFNDFPNNGLLYHTADGGLTWTISATPFSGGDLSFLDVDNGWMLADLGVAAGSNAVAVFQTTNGGATWTPIYTNDPNNSRAGDSLPLGGLKADLVPLDMQNAWVGGVIYAPGTIYLYRTRNGGQTWIEVSLELPEGAENLELGIDEDQMQFVSADDGFLVVRLSGDSTETAVYVTDDGGETWRLTPTRIPNAGASDFISAQEAIIYNGERFYITRDRAQTWTTVSPDLTFGDSFAGIDFVNPLSGWLVSIADDRRSLYRTHDGGATWLPVSP